MKMRKKSYCALFLSTLFACLLLNQSIMQAEPVKLNFSEKIVGGGSVDFVTAINKKDFNGGDAIEISTDVAINSQDAVKVIKRLDGLYLLIRAERIFDKQGMYHQFTNNYASAILTPSGLPIENHDIFCEYIGENIGVEYVDDLKPENKQIKFSNKTMFDRSVFVRKKDLVFTDKGVFARFEIKDVLEKDFLEGYYRFQIEVLAKKGHCFYRANFLPVFKKNSKQYSDWELAVLARNVSYLPVIRIGNPDIPKMIWTLFTKYYSNGTQGVVSLEDINNFQFASRHIIPAKFILPPPEDKGGELIFDIEPDFPTMFAKNVIELEQGSKWEFQTPIPLNYKSGELSVCVENPDGRVLDLGEFSFAAASQSGATTNSGKFKYAFKDYGRYLIKMKGWIEDIWGNRYNGGGTYEVWVANRLTFATSVKPGTPFEAGNSYSPSVIINPPCPADVSIDISLYRNSSKEDIKKMRVQGKANRFGYFYPREKFLPLMFDCQGEYLSEVTAAYIDKTGRLWMGNQRSGSVVAPPDSKLNVHGALNFSDLMPGFSKRGNINYEGQFLESKITPLNTPEYKNYTSCTLFSFPYNSGDILYIANSFRGDNGMVPFLTFSCKEELSRQAEGDIIPFSTAKNNYHPQGYPEFLEKQSYGYMSAIRSGFLARFMIANELNSIWDAYWQSGGNFAGRQINNSYNGDLPQDIYEFLGGVVYRDFKKGINLYGIYASMGVVIPKGSYANRISAPLSEPIFEVNGKEHYLFDAGAPLPGLVLETGDILRAGAMVFPPLSAVKCVKRITSPSGKQYIFEGTTNKIGLGKMAAAEGGEIVIKEPGVYQVQASCEYNNRHGDIVGSRDGRYYIYAVDAQDTEEYFNLDLPKRFSITYDKILDICGTIKRPIENAKIYYTVIMPGIIMDEGILDITDNKFFYRFSPRDAAVQFPNYDIVTYNRPAEQLMADTVIFTFFLCGFDKNGKKVNAIKQFILRGDKGIVLD